MNENESGVIGFPEVSVIADDSETVIVAATLLITHRDNIARLLAGSEGQFKARRD